MDYRKILCAALSLAMAASLLTGCGNSGETDVSETRSASVSQADTTETSETEESTESSEAETEAKADENADAAAKLLTDLNGSYRELWPVILADDYKQLWLDDSAEIVGEENAEGAFEKMSSMVTGTVIGEEAVEKYADGGMAYCCEFMQGVDEFTFDGDTISGTDSDGNELFSHTYHYIGMEDIRGLYIYESDDADSGEFTYFCMAPDTMSTTWHIEFRYGSDLEALGKYDSDKYAYWLASGISTDCTESDISSCIELFCTENLSE